jgi:hypothetical protein
MYKIQYYGVVDVGDEGTDKLHCIYLLVTLHIFRSQNRAT